MDVIKAVDSDDTENLSGIIVETVSTTRKSCI